MSVWSDDIIDLSADEQARLAACPGWVYTVCGRCGSDCPNRCQNCGLNQQSHELFRADPARPAILSVPATTLDLHPEEPTNG